MFPSGTNGLGLGGEKSEISEISLLRWRYPVA